ncbi:MAG: caspase family protein [Deltaproteobacteria bacterium]|nr:caspase family protein [Deltaproteobacteria bacterium]
MGKRLFILSFISLWLVVRPASAGEPPATPFIRINAGMHSAKIMDIAADAGGKYLATASFDKTVRVWEAQSGRLVRTIHPPIGDASEGALQAVAVSPDGKTLATAGFTGMSWDKGYCVYIFDLGTGGMISRITGFPQHILRLAYSRDGKRLAVALANGGGLHVHSSADSGKLFMDSSYRGNIFAIDFAANGNLIAASDQGEIRLYRPDGSLVYERTSELGRRISSIAFSPDGVHLAVGYEPDSRREVDILDAADGSWVSGLQGVKGALMSVAWSADGRHLFAAGGKANNDGWKLLIKWSAETNTTEETITLPAKSAIRQLLPLKNGSIAFVSRVSGFGVLSGSGNVTRSSETNKRGKRRTSETGVVSGATLFYHPLAVADFEKNHDTFKISPDSATVLFSYERHGQAKALFDLKLRRLTTERPPGAKLLPPRFTGNGIDVRNWEGNSPEPPLLNGTRLRGFSNREKPRSLAVRHDEAGFVLGSSHFLRSYDRNGKLLWKRRIAENAWDVNISADNRTIVAAFDDGTIRWFGLADGRELYALYLHPDRRRWLLWLPDGYFDHGPDSEVLIGFQVNRGKDREATLIGIDQMYDLFYRPDIVERAIAGEDISAWLKQPGGRDGSASPAAAKVEKQRREQEERAAQKAEEEQAARMKAEQMRLAQQKLERERVAEGADDETAPAVEGPAVTQKTALEEVINASTLPPIVRFVTRSGSSDKRDVTLVAQLCDAGGGIGNVTLFLNNTPVAIDQDGRALKVHDKGPRQECRTFERTITLGHGGNVVSLMAFNRANTIESERDRIELNLASPAPARPRLHILTVAVNRYRDGDLRLNYSVNDARELARLVREKGAPLFAEVRVHALFDEEVTRAGLEARFAEIGRVTNREDVFLLFLAGHGVTGDRDGMYYFLPVDFRYTGEESISRQGISMNDFKRLLSGVQAMKSLILLDTCNSGSFAEAIASRGVTEKTALTKLARAVGRATIAASSRNQVALEGYEGHGVFSYTLLEGINGKAANQQGEITINRLATFIEETLPELTYRRWGYEQVPQKTLTGNDFPIGIK